MVENHQTRSSEYAPNTNADLPEVDNKEQSQKTVSRGPGRNIQLGPDGYFNNGQAGLMFDINTKRSVTINGFTVTLVAGTWDIQVYYTTGNTYNGVESAGIAGQSNENWNFVGQVRVTSSGTTSTQTINLPFSLSQGCSGIYLTSTESIGGGPISYSININGNPDGFSDGIVTVYQGISRTAIPGPFTGITFGTSSGAPCTSSTNYRILNGSINYVPDTLLADILEIPEYQSLDCIREYLKQVCCLKDHYHWIKNYLEHKETSALETAEVSEAVCCALDHLAALERAFLSDLREQRTSRSDYVLTSAQNLFNYLADLPQLVYKPDTNEYGVVLNNKDCQPEERFLIVC